jgi:alpha-beta hydrolase superfamily lysophospholipase
MAMKQLEGWYEGTDGLRLYYRAWQPDGPPAAAMVLLHGLGDHSGLYPMVSDYFLPRGVAVRAPDLRGNGRSPGQRGYIGRWRELRDDLRCFLARVREEIPDAPLFLLGNSLGGLLALDFALEDPAPLRGVIAIAPPLGALGVPAPLLFLGRVLSRVWPRFSLQTGMDLSGLSRDPAVVDEVLADPLFHRRGTARLSTEVTATIARVQAAAPRFPLPVLVLHGEADRMVPPDGSRAFVARVGHPDKRLIVYPGAYHVLLADLDQDRVLADIAEWIDRHR